MLELILVLAVLVGVLGFVLWPLLGDSGKTEAAAAAAPAAVSREDLEEALADLEYDRGAGKISLEDYERLRPELLARIHALPPAR